HAGSLSLFNNGNDRYPSYSSVEILSPPTDESGNYTIQSNGTYGPNAPDWSWNLGEVMYSGSISGVDMLPNGNMVVTHGTKGTLLEVDSSGEVVWTYINPVGPNGPYNQSEPVPPGQRAGTTANAVFKAHHISATHPALLNRTLTPLEYVENWQDLCPTEVAWGWDRNGDGCVDDTDADGVTDPYDRCPTGDDTVDVDLDDVPDACDAFVDSDDDGVPDEEDACQGHDDSVDADVDGVPEPCDDLVDSDNDGVADDLDQCNGEDDKVDVDSDGVPDGCDERIDSDNDGVPDESDACPDGDDTVDDDEDGTPNACDESPHGTDETNLGSNDTLDGNTSIERNTVGTGEGLGTSLTFWTTLVLIVGLGVALASRSRRHL
ncbi:MAG: hypothetical protein O3C36_01405, partial [archaeon]|nr:hypothetical protein [archaeon]